LNLLEKYEKRVEYLAYATKIDPGSFVLVSTGQFEYNYLTTLLSKFGLLNCRFK